ncbi:hypothetical protein AB0H82_19850 [Streptomyces sp. NPDC050732]|uniref:hypothetical protein n=1 Tax=Streptomyces sp. NPDC050732 TaxID=3154632 RepID=UPI00342DFE03
MEDTRPHPDEPERPEQPRSDEPDWIEQSPSPTARGQTPDPVLRVWQLPRFQLGGRRFSGRIDHALVFVTRKGKYETFMPPKRPVSTRRYVALYEVDTDPHSFALRLELPSTVDSFEFEAAVDVTWRVTRPDSFVASQERDVPALLTRRLLPLLRAAGRDHTINASADAESAVQQAVDAAGAIGEAEGLQVSCSVRVRRDAAERVLQERLRTARHEVMAARPEYEAAAARDQHNRRLMADQVTFYTELLAKGGTAALALHLAEHRDDTRLVLEHLRADQSELAQSQLQLIKQVLESKELESYELEVPHQLIAQRMAAILEPTDTPQRGAPSSTPQLSERPELPEQPT